MPVVDITMNGLGLLDLHRLDPRRYPVLLESASDGPLGAWDMLLLHDGASLTLHRDGVTRRENGDAVDGGFLDALDRDWQTLRIARADSTWPFRGGWAVLLGYESAMQIEPILQLPSAPGNTPIAQALRCPAAVVRHRATGATTLMTEPDATHWHDVMQGDIAQLPGVHALPEWRPPVALHEDPPQRYLDSVARILDYLAAGDVFQVNLSRGWRAEFAEPLQSAALHAQLRKHNPAPFAGLFHGGDWVVVSASPERLIHLHGDIIQTRPIAGTRPRFAGDDDAARIRELVGNPKERAEHVMLIDLERNDLGRVCVPGSIDVDEMMGVESYAHVHHIVSNVRGRLRDDVTPAQAIAAVFPGGTITGCPKVRCMQIIAELEGVGRGAYTGAMGWLNRDGDMDFNILIRSAEVQSAQLRFRTGAGIVADSDAQRELAETRTKARGMLRALQWPDA